MTRFAWLSIFFSGLISCEIEGSKYGSKENQTYSKPTIISLNDYDNFRPAELQGRYERRSESQFCNLADLSTRFCDASGKDMTDYKKGKEVSKKDTRRLMQSKHRKLETDLSDKQQKKRVGDSAFKNHEEKRRLGCGFPVCVEVDMIPKRFKSICHFSKWMLENEESTKDRVFMVQKQDCAHIIDKTPFQKTVGTKYRKKYLKNADKPIWSLGKGSAKRCDASEMCNIEICVNMKGVAHTFQNVAKATKFLKSRDRSGTKDVVAIGIGDCESLYYKGCINTEFFDMDDPSSDDFEEESVPSAHKLVLNSDLDNVMKPNPLKLEVKARDPVNREKSKKMKKTHKGIHRSCPPENIVGDAEFRTTDGQDVIKISEPGGRKTTTDLNLECFNSQNVKKKLPMKYDWSIFHNIPKGSGRPKVGCMDFKFRYCCKDLWGEPVGKWGKKKKPSIKVNKPPIKHLFANVCTWRPAFSITGYREPGKKDVKKGDVEAKALLLANHKLSKKIGVQRRDYCNGDALSTRFIDVRTNTGEMLPYDEVKNQNWLKVSPRFGAICLDGKGKGQRCKDYKVSYCCVKNYRTYGTWESWEPWTVCSAKCGSGRRTRTRSCKKSEEGMDCYRDGQHSAKQVDNFCNPKPCADKEKSKASALPGYRSLNFKQWSGWSDCSVTCGLGLRKRTKPCEKSEKIDRKFYKCSADNVVTQVAKCVEPLCSSYKWSEWSPVGCPDYKDKKCGPCKGHKKRMCIETLPNSQGTKRACQDDKCQEYGQAGAVEEVKCPKSPECKGKARWMEWTEWTECSVPCKDMTGFRKRSRTCLDADDRIVKIDLDNLHDDPEMKVPCGKASETEQSLTCKGTSNCKGKPGERPCLTSSWGEWSSCDICCGTKEQAAEAFRIRHRQILKNEKGCKTPMTSQMGQCVHCNDKANATKYEKSEKLQYSKCVPECPRDCEMSSWGAWFGNCKSCGYKYYSKDSIKTRERHILKKEVEGSLRGLTGLRPVIKCTNMKKTDEVECGEPEVKEGCKNGGPDLHWGEWGPCKPERIKGGRGRSETGEELPLTVVGVRKMMKPCYGSDEECEGYEKKHPEAVKTEKCVLHINIDATYEPWSKWSACMSQEGKEVKCGYCKKTRTRKCKKTVLDQIQTLKDPESIKKAEAMLCQKKEINWTSYEFLGSCFKESKGSYGMAVQAQPDDYKMWVPIQKSEVFSDGIQESVESDERPDKDSGEDKDDPPEGEANKDGPSEEDVTSVKIDYSSTSSTHI